jgi:hypothetical protein
MTPAPLNISVFGNSAANIFNGDLRGADIQIASFTD